jgi:hypothetical protein
LVLEKSCLLESKSILRNKKMAKITNKAAPTILPITIPAIAPPDNPLETATVGQPGKVAARGVIVTMTELAE